LVEQAIRGTTSNDNIVPIILLSRSEISAIIEAVSYDHCVEIQLVSYPSNI
jgi:hypothetical protein